MSDTDFYVNKYPPGSGYIFLAIFILFGIEYLWRGRIANRFFSKKWCEDDDKFSRNFLVKKLIELAENTNFGIGIHKFTTVYIKKIPVAVIYAQISHSALGAPTGTRQSKGFVTFSNFEKVHDVYDSYSNVFKFYCEYGSYKVYLIKNMRKFENLLLNKELES